MHQLPARDAPYVKKWDAAYRAAGLVVVGVHTPEFAFEHDPGNVAAAIKKEGIAYPVVQDNDFTVWNAYMNRYWPAKYLIDASGAVRAKVRRGRLRDDGKRPACAVACRQPAVDLPAPVTGGADVPSTGPTSPEMYLGARRDIRRTRVPDHWPRVGAATSPRVQTD